MVEERFTITRTLRYTRVIAAAVLVGAMVGLISSAVVGVGLQYLGPLQGYSLGALMKRRCEIVGRQIERQGIDRQ